MKPVYYYTVEVSLKGKKTTHGGYSTSEKAKLVAQTIVRNLNNCGEGEFVLNLNLWSIGHFDEGTTWYRDKEYVRMNVNYMDSDYEIFAKMARDLNNAKSSE